MPDILTPVIDAAPGEDLTYPEALRRSAKLYDEELDVLSADDDRRGEVQLRRDSFAAAAEQWDPCPYAPQGGCTSEDCTAVPVGGFAHPRTERPNLALAMDGTKDGEAQAFLYNPATGTAIPVNLGDDVVEELDDGKPALLNSARARTEARATKSEHEEPERIPNRLIYADEVREGMGVLYPKPCPNRGLGALLGDKHTHGQGIARVLRIRQGEGAQSSIYSAIVVDEEGEQQPMVWTTVELVRVVVEG
ncbi:hypothetical protein [Phycicoccus sp.]|uniref:hypothetical protein n=1 Tax=Phycicoccus sp. TaxID=1902410 RepID=UPI002CCACECE|nr:hypothetical protein [Phycicoccus sp.]HMM95368.1 hypothetical protein [Phycicoccus sp.]